MNNLLTKKELAEKWQVTEQAIDKWRREGIISNCKGIPSVRFSPQHIADLEGVRLERFSPLEKRTMEREIEKLRIENERLKGILANILAESSKVIGSIS